MDSTSCSQHTGARPPGSAEGQNGVVSCNDCAFQPSTAPHSSAQVQLRKRSRDPMAPMAPMPAMGLASWSQDDPKLRGLRGNKGLNYSCPLRFPLTLLPPHPYSPSASKPQGGVRVRGPLIRVRGSPSPSRLPVPRTHFPGGDGHETWPRPQGCLKGQFWALR